MECQILVFPHTDRIYKCGSPVRGTVSYKVNKPTVFESITIVLNGKGKCIWHENVGKVVVARVGTERYVTTIKHILEAETEIDTGVYDHSFEFYLPPNLPSSFKDTTCTISYKIVAIFKRPGLFGINKFKTEIPVQGDLQPSSAQPLFFALTKKPFALASTKPIILKMEIDKTFLAPGDNIAFKCLIENNSGISLTNIMTKLVKKTTYISNDKYVKIKKKVIPESKIEFKGSEANTEEFVCIVPTLPDLRSLQNSEILKVEYKLNVTAKLPFPHRDASVAVPIVIGEQTEYFENVASALPQTKKSLQTEDDHDIEKDKGEKC